VHFGHVLGYICYCCLVFVGGSVNKEQMLSWISCFRASSEIVCFHAARVCLLNFAPRCRFTLNGMRLKTWTGGQYSVVSTEPSVMPGRWGPRM